MGGELLSLIEIMDFSSKTELLEKLRNMRKSTYKLEQPERSAVREMIGVAVQQTYFTTEKELLHYKNFLNNRKRSKEEKHG